MASGKLPTRSWSTGVTSAKGSNLGAGLVPNLDSVEEFRLITNSFDAEYGKFSGAVMNAITKSGTNAYPRGRVRIFAKRSLRRAELL